jgi:hypothetical protein
MSDITYREDFPSGPDLAFRVAVEEFKDAINNCAQPTLCTGSDQLQGLSPEDIIEVVHRHVQGLLKGQLQLFAEANQQMMREAWDAGVAWQQKNGRLVLNQESSNNAFLEFLKSKIGARA